MTIGSESTNNTEQYEDVNLNYLNKWSDSWNEVINSFYTSIDPQIFKAYFSEIKLHSYDNQTKTATIIAPSKFVGSQIDKKYKEEIINKLNISLNINNLKLKIVSNNTKESVLKPIIIKKNTHITQNQSKPVKKAATANVGINKKYEFNNFVVGNNNQFCHAACSHVADKPGKSYNPLFIYGGVGLGKTHLLHAIANQISASSPDLNIHYISSESFTNQLINSLRTGAMDKFKTKFRNIDVLLIDDIQFIAGKERTQEEFFHTFNTLHNLGKQIIITSDKLPEKIPGIEDRLKTRFAWGLTADVQAPDFETRCAILKRKAALENTLLPKNVCEYIAENISTNVRALEGALNRVIAQSMISNLPISLELCQKALEQHTSNNKKRHLNIKDIKGAVANYFSIKVSEINSKKRSRNISFPRHIAMYLTRQHTSLSYPEIGIDFKRDHSSIIHACSVVKRKMDADSNIKNIIAEIEKSLF